MQIEISPSQRNRVAKIVRLREYFNEDKPEVYEWLPSDEALDFALMTDGEVAAYLKT